MATRSRSDRAAVLASSVQRSNPAPYPSKARSTLVRRTVVVVLVLLALALLTISFRSPTSGALHSVQDAAASALRPFQVAATRVAQPFRDAYDYLASLSNVKAENTKLKQQNAELRAAALAAAAQLAKYPDYQKLLHLEQGRRFPQDFKPVNAAVITYPSGPFAHQLTIAAGSNSGLRVNTPVMSGVGLVGHVTNVSPDTAVVTTLADPQSFVTARDLQNGVRGGVKAGPDGTLSLTEVLKQFRVNPGDEIVTAGTRNARYPDLYPYGIPIGRVSSVGVTDTEAYLQVQLQPYVNFSSLDAVAALVPKRHR